MDQPAATVVHETSEQQQRQLCEDTVATECADESPSTVTGRGVEIAVREADSDKVGSLVGKNMRTRALLQALAATKSMRARLTANTLGAAVLNRTWRRAAAAKGSEGERARLLGMEESEIMDKTTNVKHSSTEEEQLLREDAAVLAGGEDRSADESRAGVGADNIAGCEVDPDKAEHEDDDEAVPCDEQQEEKTESKEGDETIDQKRLRLGVGALDALKRATASGSIADVQFLIDHGAPVDKRDKLARTPLFVAVQHGHIDVVRVLLANEASVNVQGKNQKSPLYYAAKAGNLEMIELLLTSSRKQQRPSNAPRVPTSLLDMSKFSLAAAAKAGHAHIVQALLDKHLSARDWDWMKYRMLQSASTSEVASMLLDRDASLSHLNDRKETPIFNAAGKGYLDVVRKLIDRGASVNVVDADNATPLFAAAKAGHVDVVRFLLDNSATVEATDRDGKTVLMRAVEDGNTDMVKELIDQGASMSATVESGKTPLPEAARNGHVAVVELLIERGAPCSVRVGWNQTAMSVAAEKGREEIVRVLLSKCTTVEELNQSLFVASRRGRNNVVKLLLKSGASCNFKSSLGTSPLQEAAENGHLKVVTTLIEDGVSVHVTSGKSGSTPLGFAVAKGHLKVVETLIENGALVSETKYYGRCPLFSAHQVKIVAILVKNGASVDEKDYRSDTLLLNASRFSNLEPVKALVENEATINVQNHVGESPLYHAMKRGDTKMVELLLRHGASVHSSDNMDSSRREFEPLLTLAGRAGCMEIFQSLIKAGASVNVRGIEEETPLLSAARSDFFFGVQLLIKHGASFVGDGLSDGEVLLIPSTLAAMGSLCGETFEFNQTCHRVTSRLQYICSQLQLPEAAEIRRDALSTIMNMIFRLSAVLFRLKNLGIAVSFLIVARGICSRLHDLHEELTQFEAMRNLNQRNPDWMAQ